MGCWLGHTVEIISKETLIKSPFYGFVFMKCKKCGKKRIDQISFKETKEGNWVDNWKDDGGILPQISMKDKNCPICNKKMEKYTGRGGEYSCHPTLNQMEIITNEEYHYETIKAKEEDFMEI